MESLTKGTVNVDSLWDCLSDTEKSRLLMNNISVIPGIDIKTTLFLLPPTVEEVGRAYAKNGRIAWFSRTEDGAFDVRIDQDKGDSVLITDMHLYKPEDLKGLSLDYISGDIDITETGGVDVSTEVMSLEEYEPLLSFNSVDLLTMYTVSKEREVILGLPEGTAYQRVNYLLDELTFFERDIDDEYVPREGDVEKMVELYAHYIMLGNTFDDIALLIRRGTDIGYEAEDIANVWATHEDSVLQDVLREEVYNLIAEHIRL